MQYVIVELRTEPTSRYGLSMVGRVVGPFPTTQAALTVAVSMGGAAMGYYVRPIHEPGEKA